jgi:hypothetical protein
MTPPAWIDAVSATLLMQTVIVVHGSEMRTHDAQA